MGTIADDRDLQFDERIILLFSDEMWQELSETFGMENDSPAERLLELLSRQVWAFIEEGKIYLTTRSVVLCGEVVALHRGDFGFEVRNVIPTTQSYVTQAFRFGVKVDADWELITPQRGLPFPTTKGAYKLLNALLLDDMGVPLNCSLAGMRRNYHLLKLRRNLLRSFNSIVATGGKQMRLFRKNRSWNRW